MTCCVKYHTSEWMLLVETGWITMTISPNGIAYMLKQEH